jgi:hypothetical protein
VTRSPPRQSYAVRFALEDTRGFAGRVVRTGILDQYGMDQFILDAFHASTRSGFVRVPIEFVMEQRVVHAPELECEQDLFFQTPVGWVITFLFLGLRVLNAWINVSKV